MAGGRDRPAAAPDLTGGGGGDGDGTSAGMNKRIQCLSEPCPAEKAGQGFFMCGEDEALLPGEDEALLSGKDEELLRGRLGRGILFGFGGDFASA